MGLKVKVKVIHRGDPFVDHGSWKSVSVLRGICVFGRIESGMMSFSANHDGKLGSIGFACHVQL